MAEQLNQRKRIRDEISDSDSVDSAAVKRIKDDLLVLLDDPDITPPTDANDCGVESDIYELDSVMKSFEEELAGGLDVTAFGTNATTSGTNATTSNASTSDNTTTAADGFVSVPSVGEGSESGDSHPELGFLLGASDDELGLPCSTAEQGSYNSELVRVMSESSSGIGELWEFDDGVLSSYDDSFGFGCGVVGGGEIGNEFVTLDGIFDYSDVNFGPLDYSNNDNNSWQQQESLPAL